MDDTVIQILRHEGCGVSLFVLIYFGRGVKLLGYCVDKRIQNKFKFISI